MKLIIIGSLLLIAGFTVKASAQPSRTDLYGRSATPSRIPDTIKENMKLSMIPSAAEASLEGRIVLINLVENRFVVEKKETRKRFNIVLNARTQLKADKETALAGKKEIGIADFKPGQLVKIIYTLGPTVIEVRLRREKSNAPRAPVPSTPPFEKSPGSRL